MLAAKVTGGAICLRCRLRLLRQSPQLFQTPNRSVQTQRTTLERFYSGSSPHPIDQDLSLRDGDPDLENNNESQYRKRERGRGSGHRSLELRKRRLSRNRVLEEDSGNLNIDVLGKPASVIIMRDEGLYQKKGHPYVSQDLDDEPDNRPANLESLLGLQREAPTTEEVYENIDSLKPKSETTIPERRFRKLQADLMDGFLSAQLYGYLKYYKKNHHSSTSKPADRMSADIKRFNWVKEVSPWVPLGIQSAPVEDIDMSLHGYVTESTPLKERLALQIMRECWGLSITELDAGLGEMEMNIRNDSFVRLMRGTRKWMNGIDNTWFGPGEKIVANRSKLTIRIVATKTKAWTLIKHLAKMLEQVTYILTPDGFVVQERLNEDMLEEIGRLTNTHVAFNEITGHCRITWIDTEGPTDLASQGDEACRLLLTACNPQPATTRTLMAAGLENKPTGRFVMNTTSKEKLAWHDRTAAWARYILPVASEDSGPAIEEPLSKLELPIVSSPEISIPNEPHEPLTNRKPSSLQSAKWAEEFHVSTIAHFGSLLHAHNPSATPPALPGLLVANHPRVFAAATPHAVQLSNINSGSQSPVETKTSVVARFWPTPYQNLWPRKKKNGTPNFYTTFPPAPLLELRLSVSGNKIKGIESLRAIQREHVTDVMLPACLVDLRFTQDRYVVPISGISSLSSWEPLTTFLATSHLDLERGKLKTPPRQTFPVPWYPSLWAPKKRGISLPDSNLRTPLDIDTEYVLASLEVHRSISMPYEGFKLSYTSIEEEPETGRRAEITLEPTAVPDGSLNPHTLHDQFLAACQKLASTDTFWSGL
ncbi:hypothetical protein K445DRAFT_320718 [Daldinia sp. EC12]|nr:hypothetical protein K445DRAFT_320718 [Daldinia sp. EC12]